MFIDVGSFERLREGEPWVGYRQFCMLFLYPLLLQAYKDVPFHALAARLARRHHARARRAPCFSFRDRFRARRRSTHVVLHARLERRYADARRAARSRSELKRAGFNKPS